MSEALLVVDIDQRNFWGPSDIETNPEKQEVMKNIQRALSFERSRDGHIIFVAMPKVTSKPSPSKYHQLEWDGECAGCGIYENEDLRIASLQLRRQLAEPLGHRHEPFEPVFHKDTSDAFLVAELAEYLRGIGADGVKLAGCNTFICILDTARGARNAGFNVTLLRDCTYPQFDSYNETDLTEKYWLSEVKAAKPHSRLRVRIK